MSISRNSKHLEETVDNSILKTVIDKLSSICMPSLLWEIHIDSNHKCITFSVLNPSNGIVKTSKSIVLTESKENVLEIGVYINKTSVPVPNVPTHLSNLDDLNNVLMTIDAVNFCKYYLLNSNNGNRCLMFSLPLMDVCSHCFNQDDNLNETQNIKSVNLDATTSQTNGTNKFDDIQCFLCNKLFPFQVDILKHYQEHSLKIVDGYFECTVCSNLFKDVGILEHYNQFHNSVKFIKCSVCDRKFANVKQLRWHTRNHTGYERFTCDYCSENFMSKVTLQKHACRESKLHICSICKKRYATRHLLRQHQKEHQKHTSLRCKGCKKQFDENFDAVKISRHKLRCKKRQLKYPCMLCYDKFSCTSQRLCHIKKVHPLFNCSSSK